MQQPTTTTARFPAEHAASPNITNPNITNQSPEALRSEVLIRLLKGPLYRSRHRPCWEFLQKEQHTVRDYLATIGLSLLLDDSEGYAFLRQQQNDEDDQDKQDKPKLLSRRQLTFSQSLLLVALRKRLAEHDSEESAPRLIVQRQEMQQWLSSYAEEVSNEVKQLRDFDALIKKIAEMGFITALPNHPDEFEVQRILKAFISAEQIITFQQLLTSKQQLIDQESQDE
ncbi:DUF4194 domain-containing protein [Rheinheimera riviphila]|uniref:DUF4194 domain-containing protein n=1 Tax=Rheinheimera riviphila TaxID=1834037 RepID=A0A437QIF4_9GAMM|nr:DUF4194 domain-containing protein [Rheinheimera riviphila]RVU34338.1 DUF4194 domain-containing protein [Rheinheimera riviphila]